MSAQRFGYLERVVHLVVAEREDVVPFHDLNQNPRVLIHLAKVLNFVERRSESPFTLLLGGSFLSLLRRCALSTTGSCAVATGAPRWIRLQEWRAKEHFNRLTTQFHRAHP